MTYGTLEASALPPRAARGAPRVVGGPVLALEDVERALEVLEDLRRREPTYPDVATRIELIGKVSYQCLTLWDIPIMKNV